MAFPEDVFPPDECCEICGVHLDDEVVIQEFADGSLARLCAECAAGAAFESSAQVQSDRFPDPDPIAGSETDAASPFPAVENDPLEMTKELLVPVTDLIGLQCEMQAALERLQVSLERFAVEVISDSMDKTATVESRLRTLESELEKTRTRLLEAESLLVGVNAAGQTTGAPSAPAPPVADTAAQAAAPASAGAPAEAGEDMVELHPSEAAFPVQPLVTAAGAATFPEAAWPQAAAAQTGAGQSTGAGPVTDAGQATAAGQTTGPIPIPDSQAAGSTLVPPPAEPPRAHHAEAFSLEEVQWAQRFFNESPFTERIRDVRRSLGKPQANLSRVPGVEPRVLVTVTWDIVWYQYLVNLRKEAPTDERVALFREGMDLGELADPFKEKNASIDDDGRLDASELEVRLLSDPTVLITDMTPDEERALEDATEEIWDQRISPEFKWDD